MESKREWYALVYRCQRCGAVEENPQTGLNEFEAAHLMIALAGANESVQFRCSTLYPRSYHRCKDGYGIAEFIGLRNREAEERAAQKVRQDAIEAMIAAAAKEAKAQ